MQEPIGKSKLYKEYMVGGGGPDVSAKAIRSFNFIEYGIQRLLFPQSKQESSIEILDRLQYRTLRGALGYRNSTPTNVILAENNEPSMYLRFRYLSIGRNHLTKCFVTNNHQYSDPEGSEEDNARS
jgi:hypothetical protein